MTITTPPAGWRIGQLAAHLGLNARTIRYYESVGILPPARRRESGYRVYGAEDAERISFVRTAQRFGLSLDQIREVLALRDRGERPCGYVLAAVRGEVADLDARIAELQGMRHELATLLERAESLPLRGDARFCELLEHRERTQEEPAG